MIRKFLILHVCVVFVYLNEKTSAQVINQTLITTTTTITPTSALIPTSNDTKLPRINETNAQGNETFEMHRIVQPIAETHSQTQQIGRTILPDYNENQTIKGDFEFRPTLSPKPSAEFKPSPTVKPQDFRPSPQLGTYYEYNRFPVAPAFPEAKQFSGINLNSNAEKPLRSEFLHPWLDKALPSTSTTQPTWYNRINFPTTTQIPLLSVRNHPYPYLITGSYPETTTKYPEIKYPYVITGSNAETTVPRNSAKFGGYLPSPSNGGFSSKFGGNLFGGGGGGKSGGETYEYPHHPVSSPGDASLSQGWKKIIKFLTAVIPIGLFLSALTPTVINVAPVNGTFPRGRAGKNSQNFDAHKLLSSFDQFSKLNSKECQERVICELLLSASSSKNSEQHVENFLESFTEQERDAIDQIQELQKILEAVKAGSCSTFTCDNITKNADEEQG